MYRPKYASFLQRLIATFIDNSILLFIFIILYGHVPQESPSKQVLYAIFTFILSWLYFSSMESSIRKATIGKKILGIIVVDIHGKKINFQKATIRYIGKFFWIGVSIAMIIPIAIFNHQSPYFLISLLIFIVSIIIYFLGYLCVFWNSKKQAFHDIISSCLVIDIR